MTTITITNDGGQITVAMDGGEPQPVESVEAACMAVEQALGAPDADDGALPPEGITSDGMEQEQSAMDQGFAATRGGGIGARM